MKKDFLTKTIEAPANILDRSINATNQLGQRISNDKNIKRGKDYWNTLGPGLTTGASDDDPSGIATYSQVGAKYGFSFL